MFDVISGKFTVEPLPAEITPAARWSTHYYKFSSADTPSANYQTGEMPACVVEACSAYYMPWAECRTMITRVEIKEGVKSIGSFAFDGLTNIGGELVIPKTVEYIGQSGFMSCCFTKITFEVDENTQTSNLRCIAQGAFQSALITELDLPEGLRFISGSAFAKCKNLEEIYFPSTATDMGGWDAYLDYWKWQEIGSKKPVVPYCDNLRKITFANEEVRNKFIDSAASEAIYSNYHDQKAYIDAYIGLAAYPHIEDAIEDAKAGDTVVVVKTAHAQREVDIDEGSEVIIPKGVIIQIPEGQTLNNKGTLVNFGNIKGSGTVSNKDSGKLASRDNNSIENSITVTGSRANIYLLTYNLDEGIMADSNPDYYIAGSSINLNNPTKRGYEFTGWTVTGSSDAPNTSLTVSGLTQDVEYTANWKAIDYDLTFSDDDCDFRINSVNINGNSVDLPITNAHYGQEISFTAHNLQKVTLSSPNVVVEYDGNGTYSFEMPDEDVVIYIEVDLDKIDSSLDNLESKITALDTAIREKATAAELASAVTALNSAIDAAKAASNTYTDAEVAALTTALEAADATINSAIDELETKVSDLETGLTAANGKIDTNTSDVATLKTDVAALQTWKDEALDAIDSLKLLSATKEELKAAVESLEAAIKTANDNISEAVKRIEALEGKVEGLESAKEELEKAIKELQTAMANTASTEALAKEVKDLNAAIAEAKKSASDADTALKDLFDAANAVLSTAVTELQNKLTGLEIVLTSLNESVNTNTTDVLQLKNSIQSIELWKGEAQKAIDALATLVGTNESNVSELQNSVTKLQESVYVADGKIAAAEARIAVLEGKVEELESFKTEIQASVAALQAALANKADRTTLNNAVAALQASISALQSSQYNYVYADMVQKNELTAAIESAKELAISTAKDLVSEAKTELIAEIDKKADSATLEAKASELADAIALAESVAKEYADAQDAILKEVIDAEIKSANELIASLGIRMTDAETAIANLEAAVEALNKATAEDAQALKDAVAALNQALAEAKALADAADAALDSALNQKITDAQTALDAKIADLQSKLNKAIKELKAADTSNANDLKKAIDAVETAMSAADAVRDAADKALETKIAEAKSELANKIAEVEANLSSAKDELNKALAAGDADLGEKVKALNEALEAAKAAYAASDADLKAELTAKIDEADTAIYALIEQIQKELKEANSELNVAVTQADEELKEKVTISTAVASVGVGGNVALLAWIIISKKRKLF